MSQPLRYFTSVIPLSKKALSIIECGSVNIVTICNLKLSELVVFSDMDDPIEEGRISLRRAAAAFENDTDFKFVLSNSLEPLKASIDKETNTENSICLKLLQSQGKLQTFIRDHASAKKRRNWDIAKKEYYYRDHSPFAQLVDQKEKHSIGRLSYSGYYLSNDLTVEPWYTNSRDQWSDDYKATVVVPVTPAACDFDAHIPLLGFLCVDNLVGNYSFETVLKLRLHAIEIYYVFEQLHRHKIRPLQKAL